MTVELEDHGAVRLVRLARPEKANAINAQMTEEVGRAFAAAADDSSIRVLVLTGSGSRHFCGGMDLAEFAAATKSGHKADRGPGLAVFTESYYPKPIIVAVNGVAAGGGFGMVLAGDIILAAEDATFLIPEVRRGLVGVGVTSRATLRLPSHLVLRMALTGDALTAVEAKSIGLVSEILPSDELVPRALEMAKQIAGYDSGSVQAAKKVVALTSQSQTTLDLTSLRQEFRHITTGAPAKAGASAFVKGER
jgi:crotonobetainyl-CoA hydratase